jgi:hypothetical protein
MVDGVIGAEILNRQEVRYSPREMGDVQVNELITAADEWARELSDTEDEESDAFADTVICGEGWTETRMDYEIDPEGRIIDDRIDSLEMWPDHDATKRCYANARYLIRARWRDKEDIPEDWKKKIPGDSTAQATIDEMDKGWTGPRDDYEREDEQGAERNTNDRRQVWIRHFQWWELEDAWRIADPLAGKMKTVKRDELKKINGMFLQQGMRPPQAVKIKQRQYYEAFVCGNVILEKDKIDGNDFTFKAITGKRDRNAGTFYGVVRAMIDPQMWGNKFFVQIMHILNTAAKGGMMYESGAFTNPRKAIEDWPKPDAAIELEDGALSGANPKVAERKPTVFPQGTEKMLEFTLNNLPQTAGIPLEMLGLVEREQAGVLENTRKKAGYALLAVFFDSLRRYRKMKGRVRLFFIQNYISDGRLIRIKGKNSGLDQYVPLVRDKDTATYDVIVDDAPMSPNQKEQVWQMMMQLAPMLAKLPVPPEIWQTMIEYSPLPSSVSSKMIQAMQKAAQQPPPPDPAVEKAKADIEVNKQKVGAEMQRDQQMFELDMRGQQMELAGKAAELDFKREELGLKRQEAMIDMQTTRQKAALDMQVKREGAAVDLHNQHRKGVLDLQLAREKSRMRPRERAPAH